MKHVTFDRSNWQAVGASVRDLDEHFPIPDAARPFLMALLGHHLARTYDRNTTDDLDLSKSNSAKALRKLVTSDD